MFEIHVGELRATFLRNHNMRRHKDPKRKTTQAEDAHIPGNHYRARLNVARPASRRRPHPRQPPQARGRCTRYVAVHPNRRGALPTDRVHCPNEQEQTRNWHTEPLTAAPLHAQLGPTGGRMGTPPPPPTPPPALQPTPAQSNTSYTLTCEEPVFASVRWVAGLVETWKSRRMPKWPRWRKR